MKKKYIDILSGIALILFAAFGWWQTSSWVDPVSSAGISVKAYPRAVFAAIFICGVIILVRTFIRLAGSNENLKAMMQGFIEMHPVHVIIVIALMVAYIYALKYFGFIFTTPFFLFAFMLAYGERKWVRMIIISVIGTVVLWAFFVEFMHVRF